MGGWGKDFGDGFDAVGKGFGPGQFTWSVERWNSEEDCWVWARLGFWYSGRKPADEVGGFLFGALGVEGRFSN